MGFEKKNAKLKLDELVKNQDSFDAAVFKVLKTYFSLGITDFPPTGDLKTNVTT
jgi:hypothetical protein